MLHRHPPVQTAQPCCPAVANHRLQTVAIDSRSSIQVYSFEQPLDGKPFVTESDTQLRDLTLEQCEYLAARSSPLANQLESEKSVLCRSGYATPTLLQLLDLQAAHERNASAGQAMRVYLGLVEVHLQHALLDESRAEIDRAQQTVEKLRSEQVAVPTDDGELVRQKLEIDRQVERLRLQSQQLTEQLETMLSLDRSQVEPLWTNYQSQWVMPEFDIPQQVATGLQHREDWAALQILANHDTSRESLDLLRPAARGVSPWMGIVARQVGLLPSHRTRNQDQAEASGRQCQMALLAEQKRQSIEAEVTDAILSIQSRTRVMELLRQSIESMDQSLAAAEQAKDFAPLDLATDLEKRLARIKLRSDLIHEVLGLEGDVIRLKQAQGMLGRGSMEPTLAGAR